MKKIFLLTAILTILFINSVPAQEIVRDGKYFASTVTKEFDVPGNGKLILRGIKGDVVISSWSQNKVHIIEKIRMEVYTDEEARKIIENTLSRYKLEGTTVLVEGFNGKDWIDRDFTIQVPLAFSLNIQTKGGDIQVRNVNGEIALNTSGGDIEVAHAGGNVNVTTSGGDLELSQIQGLLTANTSGGDIEITNLGGVGRASTSGGSIKAFDIKKDLSVNTSGGDIEIQNIAGNLDAHTSGGEIVLTNCQGKAKLNTSGGDIELNSLNGSVTAHTSGGEIVGHILNETVNVTTSGGDIELSDIKAATTAKTSGGDVRMDFTLTNFSKPHSIELGTSGGGIVLTIPQNLPASIDAKIYLDDEQRYFKRYDIYSDFPLSKENLEENGKEVIRATGDINGGGDPIILQTSGGEIRIQKR